MIHPALEELALDYEWSGDNNRWVKEYEVFLEDINQPKPTWFRRSTKRRIGDRFWVVACSSDFLANPNDEFNLEDLNKAIIQKSFNQSELERYLKSRIGSIGEVSPAELFSRLDEFLTLDSDD